MEPSAGIPLPHGPADGAAIQDPAEADRKAKAMEMKDRGNQLYKEKKFLDAALFYTEGIQLDPALTTLHSNRSAVYIEMAKRAKEPELRKELLDRALRDSAKSIEIDSNWEKGYLRMGGALEALGKSEEAARALEQGLKLNPESKDIKEKLHSLASESESQDRTQEVSLEPILEPWRSKTEEEEKAWIEKQIQQQKQRQQPKGNSSSSSDEGPLAHLGFKEKPGAKEHPGRKFIQSGPPPLVPRPKYQEEYDDDDDLQYTVIDHSARQREREKQKQGASEAQAPTAAEEQLAGGNTSTEEDGGKDGEKQQSHEASTAKPGLFRRMLSYLWGPRKPPDSEQQTTPGTALTGDQRAEVVATPNPKFYKWAIGVGEDNMYEWFLDCYRFQESGGPDTVNADFHSPLCTRLALLPFLLFCKLAVRKGALPPHWDWSKFLSLCKEEVWKKLSHDEALERYGRMVMLQCLGDESPNMITTAEHMYACQAGMKMPEETKQQQRETSKAFYEWCHGNSGRVFSDVGGRGPWEWLAQKEPPVSCNCKKSKWAKQFDLNKEEENDRWDKRWESKDDWAKSGEAGEAFEALEKHA